MEELVSLVIPTYNRADLVEESILSAIHQTYANKEIIVVDDGSTDDTKEVCEKYVTAGQIRYIYKQNGGIASALNRGIAEMNGTWFKWLSSDDVLVHNAVEELLHFALENNTKAVYSDYMLIDQDGNKVGEFIEPTYKTYLDFASSLWQQHIGNGSSTLIHKSIFERVGLFDATLKFGEDYDLWLHACILYGIMFYRCPQILLKYRVHSQQLSGKVRNEALKNNGRIRQRVKEQYISTYGKREWIQLMDEFKKRGKVRPLWRRVARKVLYYLPQDIRKSIVAVYNSRKQQHTELAYNEE